MMNKEIIEAENKLINEISNMKFSFKKLRKVIQLEAFMTYYNK